MTMKIEKRYGVVYFEDKIISVKTPGNDLFPAIGTKVFECDSQEELDRFINDNNLSEDLIC